jgi:DNA-binding CsgD family transcriptional regulator
VNQTGLVTDSLPIRGRAESVAVIDDLLANVKRGQGVVLVIDGPPGIGKSRLVHEVAARARRVNARAISGRAYEDQQSVPFAPLFEALIGSDPPICDAEMLRNRSSLADTRYWVLRDLEEAIAQAAASAPLSITIDDVHWADAGTIVALHALVARLAQAPVMWTFTMRSAGGRPEVRDAIDAMVAAREGSARRLRLGAVDADAVAQIAGDVLGATADESVLRLAGLADGNPFLILETLRGLHEEDRIRVGQGRVWTTGAGLPQRLAATMQQRLDRLSSTARRIVQIASILPEKFSATLLAHTLEQSSSQLVAGVDEAIRADLLMEDRDLLKFRHSLLRRAARQTIPHSVRQAMERESVAIQLELGSAPEEVATQLVRCTEIGDLAAVDILRQAARSVSRSDPAGAVDLSRRALDLLRPDDAVHASVVAETVVLLNQASRFDEAQHLATSTLSSDMPAEEEAQIRLSLSIASSLWPGQRAEENRRALHIAGLSAVTRARHRSWLSYNLIADGQPQAALEAANEAVQAARETDDLHTRLMAEISLATIDCAEGYRNRCLERAAELQPLLSSPEAGVIAIVAAAQCASVLTTLGHVAEADVVVSDGLKNARHLNNSAGERVFLQRQALCDFAAGRLASARSSMIESVPEDERFRPEVLGGRIGVLVMGAIAAHTDDRPLLRQVGVAARQSLDGGPAVRRESMTTLAHAAWQRGDDLEAARWLGEDVDLFTTPSWPMDLDYVVLGARVARTSSDAGLRQRVLTAVEVHARGLLEDDRDALDEALRILAESERPLLHAGAAEDLGLAMAASVDRDDAAELLEVAFDVYSAHGACADAHRIARQLNSVGVHRRVVRPRARTGWDSLTDSELRVLELVADGATNREAAGTLRVSPHTVNAQLRSVFAKLGIHSRSELIKLARGE